MPECTRCGQSNAAGARFCNACGAGLAAAESAEHARKTVTILFLDVVGSTELGDRLDPEAVSRVFGHYFAEMRPLIERHGGTVAKFMGDAVMAVFGVPRLHEDDALRAVRAAVDMRGALDLLNVDLERSYGVTLETRTGLHTGPVASRGVVPDVDFVGGDTANVAARLQAAAGRGAILVSEATYRLVKEAVEAEPLPALELPGKATPVTAFRLQSVREDAEAVPRRVDAPMVGRVDELAGLEREYGRAVAARRCRLITLIGAAGVGKSRLAREFVARRAADAHVLVARCLPYGDGITYLPVAEMVRLTAGIGRLDARDEAWAKLAAVCRGAEDEEAVTEGLAELLGLSEGQSDSAKTFLAVRRVFEHLAGRRPVIAVFDDVQWAEQTLLDLIEYIASHAPAPIVVLCLARPELLEARPNWGGLREATTLRLQALRTAESDELVAGIVGTRLEPQVAAKITATAEGNPLFLEQLLSMLIDEGRLDAESGRVSVRGELDTIAMPSTIQAVLAARLETLEADERQALGQAAVLGQRFDLSALDALASDELRVRLPGILTNLVRKELLAPVRARRGDIYRFRHLLIRDAAYDRLTKDQRAGLHERFADWLQESSGARAGEYDEIIGYHLEQAYHCRVGVGLHAGAPELGLRAADLLAATGRRAFARGDMPAAAGMLSRAAALLEQSPELRLDVLLELAKARRFAGDQAGAEAALAEAVEQAAVREDRRAQLLARVEQLSTLIHTDPGVAIADALTAGKEAIRGLAEYGDDHALAQAWALVGHANWMLCRGAQMKEAFEKALDHTQRSAVTSERGSILRMLGVAYCFGPTPVDRAIEGCAEILRLGRGLGAVEISTRVKIAALEAMRGRFDTARELYRTSKAIGEELGLRPALAAVGNYSGPIEMLAGDYEAAERELRTACALLEELGETATLSTSAAYLARALEFQGRLDEAEEFTKLSADMAARDDLASQFLACGARARILAHIGDIDAAIRNAREAVALADRTDFPSLRGETLLDLAQILRQSGDDAAAATAGLNALKLFEAKGNAVLAESTSRFLSAAVTGERRA